LIIIPGNRDFFACHRTHKRNERRSKIATGATSKEEAERCFRGLSVGGQIEMPISNSPWGSYFGMFRDKYGIEWMVDFDARRSGE